MRRGARLGALIGLCALGAACQVTPGPAWQMVDRWRSADDVPRLDPNLEFVRLTRSGMNAYLALGYRETVRGRQVDHWYSADRIVMRVEDGRLSQWIGGPLEWRDASLGERPDWSLLARSDEPVSWQRRHDEMPGYRHGVVSVLQSRREPAGPVGVPAELGARVSPSQMLIWVREDVHTTLTDGSAWDHEQWFALIGRDAQWQVAWSRQCIAPEWCFEILPLPRP